ncbi:hypothetical protein PSFL_44470 [Pseudomonas sp. DD1]
MSLKYNAYLFVIESGGGVCLGMDPVELVWEVSTISPVSTD